MNDSSRAAITWLRTSYIAGAVADGLAGILLLIPSRMGETEFRYPMGFAASLMFGWTVLLLWANRKPMERKGVLMMTIFPVIAGLIATGVWAVASGRFPVARVLPLWVLCVALIGLMGFSYWNATRVDQTDLSSIPTESG